MNKASHSSVGAPAVYPDRARRQGGELAAGFRQERLQGNETRQIPACIDAITASSTGSNVCKHTFPDQGVKG